MHLLVFDASGGGGVARTVVNLANHLADRHDVELISLFRRSRPRFEVAPAVRISFLEDQRGMDTDGRPVNRRARSNPNSTRHRAWLDRRASRLRPRPVETEMSALTDMLLWRKLQSLRRGILVTTRPSLHLAAARFAPRRLLTIGQDHMNFPARAGNAAQLRVLRAALPRLDAFTVLTHADAEDYRRAFPGGRTRLTVIRNGLPWPVAGSSAPLENKVVVAAGRLTPEKGFGRLVDAFAPVARAHPDWQLHVYGSGSERTGLEARIDRLGLSGQVRLMGYTGDLRAALREASVFATASHREGFPMVLIEAMSLGLPLVSFDCPRGPAEIIEDGKNGRLVPDGDVPAFTAALGRLVADRELRRKLGTQALVDAEQYEMRNVVAEWELLFDQVSGVLDA